VTSEPGGVRKRWPSLVLKGPEVTSQRVASSLSGKLTSSVIFRRKEGEVLGLGGLASRSRDILRFSSRKVLGGGEGRSHFIHADDNF